MIHGESKKHPIPRLKTEIEVLKQFHAIYSKPTMIKYGYPRDFLKVTQNWRPTHSFIYENTQLTNTSSIMPLRRTRL